MICTDAKTSYKSVKTAIINIKFSTDAGRIVDLGKPNIIALYPDTSAEGVYCFLDQGLGNLNPTKYYIRTNPANGYTYPIRIFYLA